MVTQAARTADSNRAPDGIADRQRAGGILAPPAPGEPA
jgi:hypothetical protein